MPWERLLPRALRGPGRRSAWHRRRARAAIAACLVGLSAWVAVDALLPVTTRGQTSVVVAVREVPAGRRLTENDVSERAYPSALVPSGAVLSNGAAIGQVSGTGLNAGEVLTTARMRLPDALVPAGRAVRAVHVPLADTASARMVRPGDHVDLLDGETGGTVAADVVVLRIDEADRSGGLGPVTDSPGGVVVQTRPDQLGALVRAFAGGRPGAGVVLVLRPAP